MIRAIDISYQYEDGTTALKDVNFDASKGNIIGIIGSNGAGKSTLFKCLTGLVKPSAGSLTLDGKNYSYDKAFINGLRQRVNLVFQDPDKQIFFPRVFDDIAFGPRNLRIAETEVKARVDKSAVKTKVEDLMEKPVHALSYGQKKRVAIGGILAMDCELIIFDEPEAGLDPSMRRRMVSILNELAAQGKTIVISSHHMDLIYELTDYVYVLHKGRLLAEGRPEEVLSSEALLEETDLEMPWILRVCQNFKLPVVKSEAALYEMWRLEGCK